MPYYIWTDKTSGTEVEVQRKIKDIEEVPDKDECLDQGMEVEDYIEAEWERGLSAAPHIGEKNKGRW